MRTCDYCGGSGRDAVMPETHKCWKCGGLGQITWYEPPPPDGRPARRSSGKSRDPEFALGLIGIAMLFLASLAYFYSATVYFKFWAGHSQQNWTHFFIYLGVGLTLLMAVAWSFGLIAGMAFGLIVLLPVIHSVAADTGFHWLIFRSQASPGFTRFLSWSSLIAALIAHGILAHLLASNSRGFRAQPGRWWTARGTIGRISVASLGVVVTVATVTVAVAVARF